MSARPARRPRRPRLRLVAALVVAATVLLVGCRGVPTSSAPQDVTSLGLGQAQQAPIHPRPGEGARDIVEDFLNANGIAAARASASQFLTTSEQNAWSDSMVTIVADETPGTYDSVKHVLAVTGRVVGRVDKNGVYSPSLAATGDGGEPTVFDFGITTVKGEYRISAVPSSLGLLVTTDQFISAYRARPLYFYDAADQFLVPDVRYTAIQDPGTLADWLLQQLQNGPRTAMADALSSDTFPTHVQQLSARIGAVTEVRIGGARQLSGAGRNRLAAQLAFTLAVPDVEEMAIVDNGVRVPIPYVNGTQFSMQDFPRATGPRPPAPTIFYLDASGRIKQAGAGKLKGDVGGTAFNSIAVAPISPTGRLAVAGVQGSALLVAPVGGAVHAVAGLHSAQLTRPVWAPGRNEVWIAYGSNLYRVVTDGRTSKVYPVALPAGANADGRIIALRISPDGSRIALVFAGAGQLGGQLEVGTIVRNGAVSVGGQLSTISPQGVRVTDVAWADALKLYATGYATRPNDAAGVFETSVDAYGWTDLGLIGLPGKPVTIAATPGGAAWVDSNGFVWEQADSIWISPTSADQTAGTRPTYLG